MKVFDALPEQRPHTPLLDAINSPDDLRQYSSEQLPELAGELRAFLLWSLGETGGHFGAGLGVIELTLVLHYLLDTPDDTLVWDVGHQAYPHKILTGRREAMAQLRQQGGIAGFPRRNESVYDTFGTGHSSTSISAVLGMLLANPQRRGVAVIGDGAMTAGMAYEALCHAGSLDANILVILNDNTMSISQNIGGLSNYLSRLWASSLYSRMRERTMKILRNAPGLRRFLRRTEIHTKGMMRANTLFEELGFRYIGPADGHNIPLLLNLIGNLMDQPGPKLLHLGTVKGKGYAPAEEDPVKYHAVGKISRGASDSKRAKFQDVFGEWLCATAERDQDLIAITPAMSEGSGMVEYARRFPDRFYDVAIAEQHATTLAAGMACGGKKPVLAIYSTFLQRSYDQLIHDLALQKLNVLLALDRAGLVGEDGPTHNGVFDIAFLRCVPDVVIATPSGARETQLLLNTCYAHQGLASVRYPRGEIPDQLEQVGDECVELGRAVSVRRGKGNAAILAFGPLLHDAMPVAEELDADLHDMRFVQPLDTQLIDELVAAGKLLITLEEHVLAGGAGSTVLEYLQSSGVQHSVLRLGIADHFVEHATQAQMRAQCGLDTAGIETAIRRWLSEQ